jgi:peroxiredoxin
VKLEQFRGKRVLLTFFSPTCAFCQQMASALAALPRHAGGGLPLPLVVSAGDPHHNRELVAEHGIRCPVLLQDAMEVASAYGADGTPMGYLLDERGVTESEIAVGAEAVLALATRREEIAAEAAAPYGQAPLRRSRAGQQPPRAQRTGSRHHGAGLPPATPGRGRGAGPEDHRGRRLLLVFSDPACGPCNELAPRLQDLHRQMPGLAVLMVSRGDPAANRAKRAEHGLTFPIVLQRHWEISRRYCRVSGLRRTPLVT